MLFDEWEALLVCSPAFRLRNAQRSLTTDHYPPGSAGVSPARRSLSTDHWLLVTGHWSLVACLLALLASASPSAASASTDYAIVSDILDGGGGHTTAGLYACDVSLASLGGIAGSVSSSLSIRQGYPGTLNDPPVAGADVLACQPGATTKVFIGQLLANDLDLERERLTFLEASPTASTMGTVTRLEGWVFYRAPLNFSGEDRFTYTLSDGVNDAVTGTVTVLIAAGPQSGWVARLVVEPLPAGGLRLSFPGIAGQRYRIEYRDSLEESQPWLSLAEFEPGNAQFHFHHDVAGTSARFYRVVLIPTP